ncbi:SDR family oxidoreductase [Lacticaseibacillus pabuli]|uniref:SDR family oxidoreductase n=1 Tax=Lacticaseibacillus pabuli TaxID=3025672 RepID=A0ABY7WQQ6_9LACO|nr:SDR family oxidoreductase [Lacticaseibacillus sp. KACC 23028]WDF82114.1 SDR family oxidoreductase [Lacticaseibacillus sp. KACC 23028]
MTKPLIVITGASSGFGAAMAKMFNEQGNPMLLVARRTDRIEALPLDFKNIMVEGVDVTDREEFAAAIAKAEAKFGPTDLLVNNAGVMLLGNVMTQDPKQWQTMLDVNVMGVLNGMSIVLPEMTKREGGTIINMSSLAGKKTFVNHAAYVASKFGVHGLSETIREEVSGKNVRVAMVAPGAAETELLGHTTDTKAVTDYEAWKQTMGGVTMDPMHVAEAVNFIYSMPQDVNVREIDIAATRQDS